MKYIYEGHELYPVVELYHDLIPYLAGIKESEFYMDAEKCADAWREANGQIEEYFGGRIPTRVPSAAPISYGHLISLGARYIIPEDSEPVIKPFAKDIYEAIRILKDARGMDYCAHELCRHYFHVNEYLQSRFPEVKIPPLSAYGFEGIITSAVLMRGQDIFIDIYEEAEKVHEYFELLNQSIIEFCRQVSIANGQAPISASGAYLCDDHAALIPPQLWDSFVIPYWNEYYAARTNAKRRFLHCEGTSPEQLEYLSHAHITHYQPSVANKLTLDNVKAHTDVPFDWLLYAWKLTDMTQEEIQTWVDGTVDAGVRKIRTQLGKYAWSLSKQNRAMMFLRAFDKYSV